LITVTVVTIGFVLIKKLIIAFDEIVPLKNHLIHHRQIQDYTASGSISVTVNHEEAGAKRLEHLGVFNSNWSLSRSDSKHRYKFLDFISSGNKFLELSKKYTVTIATQSSLEKLHYIVEVSRQWTGPISLAVFVAGEEYRLTEVYISYLRQCFTHVKDQISFQLAYSWDYPPSDGPNHAFDYKRNCSNPEAVLLDLLKYRSPQTIKWKNNTPYPQNHLRNQARANCQTEYIYVLDVDIIPCTGMADNLDQFLRKSQCEKLCAYVIPVYEIDEKVGFPRNKSEMLELAKNKMARPFHQEIYAVAQHATDYAR
jgi:N-acetyllactosaminide beta-1,3-N-acetylglucosaminyltransferase